MLVLCFMLFFLSFFKSKYSQHVQTGISLIFCVCVLLLLLLFVRKSKDWKTCCQHIENNHVTEIFSLSSRQSHVWNFSRTFRGKLIMLSWKKMIFKLFFYVDKCIMLLEKILIINLKNIITQLTDYEVFPSN